jgi:hypothetical protein
MDIYNMNYKGVIVMEYGMKKLFVFVGLIILSSVCYAQISLDPFPAPSSTQANYYAEYSFAEVNAGEIDSTEINGKNGWKYHFAGYWTRTDIQNRINSDMQRKDSGGTSFAFRRTASEFMSRMLGANADKRIFIIDTSVDSGPYGWLFIKINDNEYILFFTGT